MRKKADIAKDIKTQITSRMNKLRFIKDQGWLMRQCVEAATLMQQDPASPEKKKLFESAIYYYVTRYFESKGIPLDKDPWIDEVIHGTDTREGVLNKITKNINGSHNPKAYIGISLKGAQIDYWRLKKNHGGEASLNLDDPIGDGAITFGDMLNSSVVHPEPVQPLISEAELEKHLDKVSPDLRRTFEMRLNGASCKDIAHTLDKPLNTILSHLRYTREQVKQSLLQSGSLDSYLSRLAIDEKKDRSR